MPRRLPPVEPAELSGAAADLYARYATGERAAPNVDFSLLTPDGQLTGPPATWMLNPALGLAFERLGYDIRFHLSLPARWREIVILMVAAAEDSPFERYAHHRAARRAGLSEEEIAQLDRGEFVARDVSEATFVAAADAVLNVGALPESLWEQSTAALGAQAIFEIVTLVGWYRMMALQLRIFEIDPPA